MDDYTQLLIHPNNALTPKVCTERERIIFSKFGRGKLGDVPWYEMVLAHIQAIAAVYANPSAFPDSPKE